MTILLFLLLIVGVLFVVNTYEGAKTVPQVGERDCRNQLPGKAAGHHWVMKVQADHMGYLICKTCGKIPGDQ